MTNVSSDERVKIRAKERQDSSATSFSFSTECPSNVERSSSVRPRARSPSGRRYFVSKAMICPNAGLAKDDA